MSGRLNFFRAGLIESDIVSLKLMVLRAAGALGSLLISLFLVSEISMDGFGRWGEAQVAVALSAMIGALGYEVILFRYLSDDINPEVLFGIAIPQMVICAMATAILAVLVLQFSSLQDDKVMSVLVVFTAVVQILVSFCATYCQCSGRILKGQFWLQMRPYFFLLFVMVYVTICDSMTVDTAILMFLCAGLLVLLPLMRSVLFDFISVKRSGLGRAIRVADFLALLREIRFLIAGLGSNLVGYFFMRIPVIVLTTQGQFELAGIYLFAAQVSDIARLATSVFYMPFIPKVREIFDDGGGSAVSDAYHPIQFRAVVMALVCSMLLPGAAYFLADFFIDADSAWLISVLTAIMCAGHLCEVALGIGGYVLSIFGFARSLCIAWLTSFLFAGLLYLASVELSVLFRVTVAATLGIVLLNAIVLYSCERKVGFNSIFKIQ